MTRSNEVSVEEKSERRDLAVARAVQGGLDNAVGRAGGALLGFTAKLDGYDCLLVLKAEFPAGRMVAFVGSESLGGAFLKAVREGKSDRLRWRVDRFAGE